MESSKIKRASPLILIAIYIILSVIKLNYPGFQYDELLFGNAALGGLDGSFIYKKIYRLPLMLMPYIGALKAYFYYPIFLFFNPSYITVRLPTILLTAGSLWLIYKYTARGANFAVAVVSLLLLAADSSFISLTRTDVGPVVIGLFFRCLALLYFFKYIEERRGRHLLVIGVSLLLGFYDKLNFVWFIIAFAIAAAIFYAGVFVNIRKLLDAKFAKIIIAGFIIIFGILTILVLQLGVMSEVSFIPTQSRVLEFYKIALGFPNGSVFYEYLIGDWTGSGALGWIVWLLIIGGSMLAAFQTKSDAKTFHFFHLMMFALIIIQILLTNKATAPWHFFMLEPMMAILTASSLAFICRTIFARNEARRQILLTISALAIFSFQLSSYATYISDYEKPYRNVMWSKTIDDLQAYSQSVPNRFVLLDWGMQAQLLTLGRQRDKYHELAFFFNDPLTSVQTEWLKSDLMNPDKNCLFVLHNEKDTLLKAARQRFFETVDEFGLQAELIETFDDSGKTLFEIYRLKRK